MADSHVPVNSVKRWNSVESIAECIQITANEQQSPVGINRSGRLVCWSDLLRTYRKWRGRQLFFDWQVFCVDLAPSLSSIVTRFQPEGYAMLCYAMALLALFNITKHGSFFFFFKHYFLLSFSLILLHSSLSLRFFFFTDWFLRFSQSFRYSCTPHVFFFIRITADWQHQ